MAPWLGAWSADQSNVAHGNNDPTFGAQGLFDLEQLFVPDEQVNAELYDEITFGELGTYQSHTRSCAVSLYPLSSTRRTIVIKPGCVVFDRIYTCGEPAGRSRTCPPIYYC